MHIIRSTVQGYCPGVRRALELLESAQSEKLYTFGTLIHNPIIQQTLYSRGIVPLTLDNLPDLTGATVCIRAHGVAPSVILELRARGASIVDATCLRVKQNQCAALSLSSQSYCIVLAGDAAHDEIIGLRGYAPQAFIVEHISDVATIAHQLPQKTACIGQTTLDFKTFEAIAAEIRVYVPQLKVVDSICSATIARQQALECLCSHVDALLIIGGKSSANTVKLLTKARQQGKTAYLIESAQEIPQEIYHYATVGIASGASTPEYIIDDVEHTLKHTCH
ncbi:MAG: 4-hydroxy-3-methylbut-2-enyl diphosphate reductase [Treponema sp.]|jgi:4-hydroxy-3-methylbut-2-enyl diphosphate reductase|nr:4-hydroxy-3-methylbut-2-enyl diphosphate reductase [Treponema sp.]